MKDSTNDAAPSFQSYITNEGKSIINNNNNDGNFKYTINEESITNDGNNNINSINNINDINDNINDNSNDNSNFSNDNSNNISSNISNNNISNENSSNNRHREISIFDEEENSSDEEEYLPINNNNININNSETPPEQIKLYSNQQQIYLKAKEKPNNSIIFMETGKGKTLISILLMADL